MDLPAKIRAAIHQIHKVLGGFFADGGVGVGHVHAFSLHQHPVDARNLYFVLSGEILDVLPLGSGDISHVVGNREGRNLQAVITGLGHIFHRVLHGPAFKNLITNAEFHWRNHAV